MIARLRTVHHHRWAAALLVAVLACTVALVSIDTSRATTAPAATDRCATARPLTPGLSHHAIVTGGETRAYTLYVPESYDGTTRVDAVFLFHGYGGTPEKVLDATGIRPLADQQGFVVVAPLGHGVDNQWDMRTPSTTPGSDVAFVQELTSTVRGQVCLDPTGLYAAGFSNGGALALALACDPASRFTAYGVVSGPYLAPDCSQAAPSSIVLFHGSLDTVVPIDGGPTVIGPLPSVDDTVAHWVAQDRCPASGAETSADDLVVHFTWSGCADDTSLSLHVLRDGGHRWPGQGSGVPGKVAGPTVEAVDATRIMWTFFQRAGDRG